MRMARSSLNHFLDMGMRTGQNVLWPSPNNPCMFQVKPSGVPFCQVGQCVCAIQQVCASLLR